MVCNITSPITRTWLGNSAFDLRYRDGYDGNQNGVFNAPHPAVTGNSSFVQTLDQTFNGINGASSWYLGKNIAFIGHVGLSNCADSSDWHSKGRAFDLAAIYFTPGPYFMDANTTWRPQRTLLSKRLYLAIAANCRMYANTVITGYYPGDAGHDNHIHIDNGSPLGPINSANWTDATLVQSACVLLDGAAIAIDGAWGAATQAAYQNLMTTFHLNGCCSPRGAVADMRTFLSYIVACGFSNQPASWAAWGAC
jgi:hypothetical protein